MSNAAAHAHAFYRQVANERKVWTVKDEGGFPAPKNGEGRRCQLFWSSFSRVRKIIATVPAYGGFEPHEIEWESFRGRWLPGLKKDGLFIGTNWFGPRARGYDVEPDTLLEAIEFQIQQLQKAEPGAAPNGGPAAPSASSGGSEGPPSVS